MAKILKDTLDSFALLALLAQTNLYNKINLFYNIKKQHHSKHFQIFYGGTYNLRKTAFPLTNTVWRPTRKEVNFTQHQFF